MSDVASGVADVVLAPLEGFGHIIGAAADGVGTAATNLVSTDGGAGTKPQNGSGAGLPAPPNPNDPAIQANLDSAAAAQRLVRGRAATVYTSPQGLLDTKSTSLTSQTLLGS
jgi:hypothetical protein